MNEKHIHRCMSCNPDMVPDFKKDDDRYVNRAKIGYCRVLVDGKDVGYTHGAFTGKEGWALVVGSNIEDVHRCTCAVSPNLNDICLTPVFGVVTIQFV